jgi:hypothetical protein
MLESNEIIVKSANILSENDLELLIMFFENENYSNGGTIENVDVIDSNTFKIIYEDANVRNRVLEKISFKFHTYDLKCSSRSHYCLNEMFDVNTREIILRNIDETFEHSILELYADHLSPDNDIVEMKHSKLFEKTFIIVYKQELNLNDVRIRFSKRSTIKNVKIELLESFKTKSLIIKSNSILNTVAIRDQLEKLIKINFFLENIDDKYLIVQFESEYSSNEWKLLENFCAKHKLILENCLNFDLIDTLRTKKAEVARKDQGTQTEEEFDFKTLYLIEVEGVDYFNLNLKHPLGIGLSNSLQLRLNLKEYLKKFSVKLDFTQNDTNSSIKLEFSSEINKEELKNKLKDFYFDEFSFKMLQLSKRIDIENTVRNFCSKKSGVYLKLVEDEQTSPEFVCLRLYGPKISIDKVNRKIAKLTRKLTNPSEKKTTKVFIKQLIFFKLRKKKFTATFGYPL